MKKWLLTLSTSSKLRELTNSEDKSLENCKNILIIIIESYNEIQQKYGMDEDYFEDEIEDIQLVLETEEYDVEIIDSYLSDFYDTCDYLRVWISL